MHTGDIICTKAITHRQVVELPSGKRRRPRVNQFFYKFDMPNSLTSRVGVFLFLGIVPESLSPSAVYDHVMRQLNAIGWREVQDEEPATDDRPAPD